MTSAQADKLVLDQAILRHKQRELRQKREIPIPRGIGWTSKGSVLDCNRQYFDFLLKQYFSSLYVGWNPMKNEGKGCWEVWQRPSKKVLVLQGETDFGPLYTLEYQVSDFEHWVQDLPYLTPTFINRLREMDMWENKQFLDQMDNRMDEDQDKLDREEEDSIKYAVRHNKSLFRKLKGLAEDGYNPLWFFSDKRQGNGKV